MWLLLLCFPPPHPYPFHPPIHPQNETLRSLASTVGYGEGERDGENGDDGDFRRTEGIKKPEMVTRMLYIVMTVVAKGDQNEKDKDGDDIRR